MTGRFRFGVWRGVGVARDAFASGGDPQWRSGQKGLLDFTSGVHATCYVHKYKNCEYLCTYDQCQVGLETHLSFIRVESQECFLGDMLGLIEKGCSSDCLLERMLDTSADLTRMGLG